MPNPTASPAALTEGAPPAAPDSLTSIGREPVGARPAPTAPVRVAVIGAGYWGPNLVRNLIRLGAGEAHVSWVCDRDPARLDLVRSRHGRLRCTGDVERVLADPATDAVVLAVPPVQHASLGLRVLQAGKHLLVEKPMALTTRDARRLQLEADRRGLTLMVGLTYRYHGQIEAVKELIRSGELGELRGISSERTNRQVRGRHADVLWSLAPHDLSILLHLLDADPVQVAAEGWSAAPGGSADVASLRLRFPGDLAADVYLSWLDAPKIRRLVVHGTRRTVVLDETHPARTLALYRSAPGERGAIGLHEGLRRLEGLELERVLAGEGAAEGAQPVEPLRAECSHFLGCVRSGERPRTDGHLGAHVTFLLELLARSMEENGRELRVAAPGRLTGR